MCTYRSDPGPGSDKKYDNEVKLFDSNYDDCADGGEEKTTHLVQP